MITTKEKAIEVLERADDYVGIHYINGVENSYINPALKEAISFAIAAIHPISRERVEKIRGEWVEEDDDLYCSRCGHIIPDCAGNATPIYKSENKFCYYCGAPMTDEAVDILLKRLEALKDGKG